MTLASVLKDYPHIDFGYTKTNIPAVNTIPDGYRWADKVERDYWWHIRGTVVVEYGYESTDIAILDNSKKV